MRKIILILLVLFVILAHFLIVNGQSNSNNWMTTNKEAKSGSYSIQSPTGDWNSGSYILTVKNYSDSAIEGWIYMSGTNDLMSGLVIRSDSNACPVYRSTYANICNGYVLRFEHNRLGTPEPELVLNLIINSKIQTLAVYNIGQWWSNQWYHMKIQAIGSMITGYLSTTDSFSSPQITYDTSNDLNQFLSGKDGFGTRTGASSYYTYFDNIIISQSNTQLLVDDMEYTNNQETSAFYQTWIISDGTLNLMSESTSFATPVTNDPVVNSNSNSLENDPVVNSNSNSLENDPVVNSNSNSLENDLFFLLVVITIFILILYKLKKDSSLTKSLKPTNGKFIDDNWQKANLPYSFCSTCGYEIEKTDVFCHNCGIRTQ